LKDRRGEYGSQKFLTTFSDWSLSITAFFAFGIAILDFVPGELIPIEFDPGIRIILVCLGLIMTSIVIERYTKLSSIEESLTTNHAEVVSLIENNGVLFFKRREDFYAAIIRHGVKAKFIYVTHFAPYTPKKGTAFENKWHEMLKRRLHRGEVRVRRVMAVQNKEQYDWVTELISEYKNCEFFLRCYPKSCDPVPHLNFTIIDNKVCFLSDGESNQTGEGIAVAIRNEKIVETLNHHYEKMWLKAKPVNGRDVNENQVNKNLKCLLDALMQDC
jgi:hypothetical protein